MRKKPKELSESVLCRKCHREVHSKNELNDFLLVQPIVSNQYTGVN